MSLSSRGRRKSANHTCEQMKLVRRSLRSCSRFTAPHARPKRARLDARLRVRGSRDGSGRRRSQHPDAGGSRATCAPARLHVSVESASSVDPCRLSRDGVGDRAVRRRRGERRGADAARVAGGEARAPARAVRVVSRHELERLQDMQGPRQNRAQTPRRSPEKRAELLQNVRGPRAVSVRRVRGHGRGEQLAVRPDREPGVGAEGTVARPGPTAAADAREVTPRRTRGSAARAVL